MFLSFSVLTVSPLIKLALLSLTEGDNDEVFSGVGTSGRDLAEDFVVRVEGEGGGEGSDVGDERGVPERRRGGRQEGQLAHFAVGRGGRDVWAAGGARLWWVVLLRPETDHLTQKTDETMLFYSDLKLQYLWL